MLSEIADVVYMTSAYYDPSRESGFAYNDPEVGIAWPADIELSASERDSDAPSLSEIAAALPFEYVPEAVTVPPVTGPRRRVARIDLSSRQRRRPERAGCAGS